MNMTNTCSVFQQKVKRYLKKQESMTHSQKKRPSKPLLEIYSREMKADIYKNLYLYIHNSLKSGNNTNVHQLEMDK